ncbi:MAG: hypothetical protein K2J37_07495 [Ruminococcus sp.]|nr:hypothetical protein [Ruminococcus sp.]
MKFNKVIAVFSALILSSVNAGAVVSYAEGQDFAPVYEFFNENDVNGSIVISVPENSTAAVSITFDSLEVDDEPYYVDTLESGTYSFDIEGYDNTEEDYRIYTVSVELSGGKYNSSSKPYTDEFTIPDGNDTPDSFREIKYEFTIDDKQSLNDWDVENETESGKNISVHLDYIMIGDVDGSGKVDASDASFVLMEYSLLSTGGVSSWTEKKKLCGDVNGDSKIDATDASAILVYYSTNSTGGNASWNI